MQYFTSKVANELSFCNRNEETQFLLNNIERNQHTVIVAPRRYGKTSLVEHALKLSKSAYARIDLFCVVYEEDICKKVAHGISKLLQEITSFSQKTLKILEDCFKNILIGFRAGKIELQVQFGKQATDSLSQLQDLLEGVEKLAQQQQRKLVLFFDEFQDVLKSDRTNQIQATIRAVAQHSRNVTYIFSGSSRVMLNTIFDDRNQPLYMLCSKIVLAKISAEHFTQHIQTAAVKRWGCKLIEDVIEQGLTLSGCHPYYVNILCDMLWRMNEPPTSNQVAQVWQQLLYENKGKIVADLAPLNANRTKVLINIALLGIVNEPNSKLFLDLVKLPLASTQNAVKYLLNHDYIYESAQGLQLVDPMMMNFLQSKFAPQPEAI